MSADELIEAMQDAFMSKIVVDGNGGIEFFDEGMGAALAAALPMLREDIVGEFNHDLDECSAADYIDFVEHNVRARFDALAKEVGHVTE